MIPNQPIYSRVRLMRRQSLEWDTSAVPAVTKGRIGFRHMRARSSRYQNIKVFQK